MKTILEKQKKIKKNYLNWKIWYSKKSEKEDKDNDEEFSYENFLKLKKQIFQFIENNSAAKEKKQILALIKSNKNKRFWNIENLKKATGYTNLLDIYEVKEKLGNGKFGLVKLGINKQTKEKVAIKIMNKKKWILLI